ncbi:two component transcriptional regulator, winged helix family [Magnetococcus marinus MC-1]|uniref:Two component transcriptional regulator, winged helix family n=1 Tax=Magnetococcus marinus (strain ATCC BAA-1437 / JCM 17883 / MC-1) TaxID=156889 RepID=A0LD25_MAGMM|nr:response regulator [Magnetococcus marinus]ABK45868.1 two component transcriptional regulator, winged helix family [Magnetococcus marinus MC-1]
MTQQDRILIVEDDEPTRTMVADYLRGHGFEVRTLASGETMNSTLAAWPADVIVMDLMLPGEDGLTLCKRLSVDKQTADIPIIMLTARGEETDRIVGLEMGADDYLSKPFSTRELLARLRSVLRRARAMPRSHAAPPINHYHFAGWHMNVQAQELIAPDGLIVELTRGEATLLLAFLHHPNQILDREQIMAFYQQRQAGIYDRSIDVQVGRLRKRLQEPKEPQLLKTVWGKGYILKAEVQAR